MYLYSLINTVCTISHETSNIDASSVCMKYYIILKFLTEELRLSENTFSVRGKISTEYSGQRWMNPTMGSVSTVAGPPGALNRNFLWECTSIKCNNTGNSAYFNCILNVRNTVSFQKMSSYVIFSTELSSKD